MKPEVISYIKNQLARGGERLGPYVKTGNWMYSRRHVFLKIEKYIKDFLSGQKESRWVILPGLRGVGKTTVLAQLYFAFNEDKRLNGIKILYISVDDIVTAGFTLLEVLEGYEQILGKNFEGHPGPVLIFIDEVQQDEKWGAVLKSLYDKARNVFVICTGSSAVQLQSNPDIARRGIFEKLYPLSFGEFEMLKNNIFPSAGLKQEIKKALYDSSTAEEVFSRLSALEVKVKEQWSKFKDSDIDEFLSTGTLPFTFRTKTSNIYERISFLVDRMINKDIQELGKFDIQTLGVIKRLLFIMADSNDGLSVNKVSGIIAIDRLTLTSVLDALEKAEITIRIPAHGSNAVGVKKPSKYLFMSPAIRMSLLSITGLDETFLVRRGKLLEDVAGLHFYREFISNGVGRVTYDSAQSGADFILQIANKKQIAIEIGMGEKQFRQVKTTMDKVKCDYGLVFCTSDSLDISKEDGIVKVPLKFFLLT